MSDLWRWQCKGTGCQACFEAEAVIGGATCPYCGNVGIRVMLMPDTHDFRDTAGNPEVKRDRGAASDWEHGQQREHIPGVRHR